ncbi:MAG TPA: hypothetical protein VGL10_09145, partial [Gammaproteobacteria bacterium]
GSIGGANPPDSVDLSTPATPRFTFNNPLPAGNTLNFTFQVQADSDVQPLEPLANTMNARFTSLPDNSVALNSSGLIGTDGAADGMRIGFLPPAAGTDAVNDYEAQSTDTEIVPGISIVKNDLDPAIVTTIGARKHFQLVVTLPEGAANAVVVSDDLSAGDVSFLLENDTNFDITYSLQDIASINGVSAATLTTPAALEAALTAFTALDEAGGTVSWNFGTVVTANEDDATVNDVDPQIVIDYYARVANDVTTVAGVDLQNAANLNYTDGGTGNPAPTVNAPPLGPFPVVEPELEVVKDFIDLPLPTPAGSVIQGLPAEFEIQVTNTGTSTAWDATIVDMLPNRTDGGAAGGMCDTAPTITQIEVNGRGLVANTDYTASFTPAASPADLYCTFTIVLMPSDAAAPANNARIDVGETLLIRYETTLDVGTPNSSSLTNVAGATRWFSLNTDGVTVPAEIREYTRTLTLAPAPNPGTVGTDDHEDAETVNTLSAIIDVTKSVQNLTTGQNPALTAAPGETLRYTIVIENTGPVDASNLQLTDEPDWLNIANFNAGYFENSPLGTLRNVTVSVPATDNSQQSGGANGSGLLDLNDITVAAGGSVTVSFDIDVESLDQPLPHAFIENQATVALSGFSNIDSNITQTEIINTRPGFFFEKVAQDITGDPGVLATGDILRYTVTIKNIGDPDPLVGSSNAVNVLFRDQVPANTTYIANSTLLNGAPVADTGAGIPPFTDGLAVHPVDDQPGFMTAIEDMLNISNVSTVTFDVRVNAGLVNGTIISNQGVLTGRNQALPPFTPQPFSTVLTDDPATPDLPRDPTQSVVGSGVNLDAFKTAQVVTGADTVPDTGEILRYTITLVNRGNAVANNVRLLDAVPAGTTYVADSVTLNGNPVGVPDGGISPLAAGIQVTSSDLPSPGQMSVDGTAVVTFDVVINAAAGAVISNQGTLRANEQPDEPTDADGNDENGDQSTDVVVGGAPQLEISKEVVVVGGGTAQANGQLEYLIRVENIGSAPADNIVITDTIPALTAYVVGSGQIDGAVDGVSIVGTTLTADYSSIYGTLSPGADFVFSFRVTIDSGAQPGNDIDNTATVDWTGGSASDTANIDVDGAPGVINLRGRVWDNRSHDAAFGVGDQPLAGWRVRVYVNNDDPLATDTPLAETVTDAQGLYSFDGLAPVDAGDADGAYTITFSVPVTFPAGSNINLGDAVSEFGNAGAMIVSNLNILAGGVAQNENLPVDPTGVVYNSITRQAVAGA